MLRMPQIHEIAQSFHALAGAVEQPQRQTRFGVGVGDELARPQSRQRALFGLGRDAEGHPLTDPLRRRFQREHQSGRGLGAGGYFGWWNLVAKLNLALAAGLSLPLLDLLGYRPGAVGPTLGLSAVYCLLPIFFKTIAAVLAWRWRKTLESSS